MKIRGRSQHSRRLGQTEEFGLRPTDTEKQLKDFKHESDWIRFVFQRIFDTDMEDGLEKVIMEAQVPLGSFKNSPGEGC